MRLTHALKADVLLVTVTLLAALGWVFSKEAVAGMPPLLFIGTRFLIAGLTLAIAGQGTIRQLTPRQWSVAGGVGVLFAVAIMLWVLGLFYGPHLGEGAFICSLSVVLVPVMAALFFKEKPASEVWYAIPVAIGGLACLSLNHGLTLATGQLFYITAALVFSLQFNCNAVAVSRMPAIALTAIQLLVVGVIALATSRVREIWPDHLPSAIWAWLLASAFITTSLRFFLLTYAQRFASASHAAVLMILEPVWTSLIGFFWYGEHMSGWQFTGCALIFTALLINRWRTLRQLIWNTPH